MHGELCHPLAHHILSVHIASKLLSHATTKIKYVTSHSLRNERSIGSRVAIFCVLVAALLVLSERHVYGTLISEVHPGS